VNKPTLIADPSVFFIFRTAHFFNSILAGRTSGPFAFAPTTQSRPFAKPKSLSLFFREATFCHRTKDYFGYIKTIFTNIKNEF